MSVIGIDPSYSKPIAWAYQADRTWVVGSVDHRAIAEFRDVFRAAVDSGVTACVIEDGFVGKNPRVALRLAEARGELRAYADRYDLPLTLVHPKTWQAACLSQGGWTPRTTPEIEAQAIFRARAITGIEYEADEAVAVCLAEYGCRTLERETL
jgi:Holliday junction resolvasome RuvABC endonuclease subunit